MTSDLAGLRADFEQLADTVEQLVDALESTTQRKSRTVPGGWSWAHMNAERAPTVWNWLATFVDFLNTREELGVAKRVPPCWFHHGRAVEDLTALLAAWQDAYHGDDKPTSTLINYRDRWLWPTLERLTEINSPMRRCIDKGRHVPWAEPEDIPLSGNQQAIDRPTALARHISDDVAHRTDDRT